MFSSIASRLSTLMMGAPAKEEKLLIAIPFPKSDKLLQFLKDRHPNLQVEYHEQDASIPFKEQPPFPDELFKDVTILATFSVFPSKPEAAPKLKFVHLCSAGSDLIQQNPLYTETKTPITTSSGIHGPMISEWVILQMLSNSHKQKMMLGWQKEHFWAPRTLLGEMHDFVGQRIGVLGYGSIGRQVAVVSKALGLEVYAYTATPRKTAESKRDTGYIVPGTGDATGTIPTAWFSGLDKPSLHNFLAQDLDILVISVPLTKETHHFIGASEFAILAQTSARKKQGTFIANISRGSIIVQDDLERFVREGKLRGAALDVTEPEPLPRESSLWDVEGVVVTPHISSLSVAYLERTFGVLDMNVGNLEAGRRLINVVDREKGY